MTHVAKKRYANPPLDIKDPAAAARWQRVVKRSLNAYAVHRLSRVVGPGTGDDVLSDPDIMRIQGVVCCGVDGSFIPASEAHGKRFTGVACQHCERAMKRRGA